MFSTASASALTRHVCRQDMPNFAPRQLFAGLESVAVGGGSAPLQLQAPPQAVVDEKSLHVVKERLDKFVDQLHEKAKTLTGWVTNLEPPSNPQPSERAKQPLGSLKLLGHSLSRFVEDCKPLLTTMDGCFEKLAECQFRLDSEGVSDEPLASSQNPVC